MTSNAQNSAWLAQNHDRRFAAVVIGAGQAGLAAAHELRRRGLTPWEDFIVLDANDGPGGAWRHRWDSLTLGKAHRIADLPGMPMGEADTHRPASSVVADYYGSYEDTFELPIIRPAHVTAVSDSSPRPAGDSSPAGESSPAPLILTVELPGNSTDSAPPRSIHISADVVLSATGTWSQPYIPHIPGMENFRGTQLHTVNYRAAEDFRDKHTIVVGGGLSAVQFLLELEQVTTTTWATRRAPNFSYRPFDLEWGHHVEETVRRRTFRGHTPPSVVSTTGIPQTPAYLRAVQRGTLVSHGMFSEVLAGGVGYNKAQPEPTEDLAIPESWQPYPAGTTIEADVIFWNTGFRHALNHLRPLHLREHGGGITMASEVDVAREPRVKLVGYGSTASTVGANRAGVRAGREAMKYLERSSARG